MIYIFLFLILLIIDQYSKFIVDSTLSVGETVPVIDNFFNLTYVQNRGVAFGLFQGKIDIVSILAIIAIGLILFYFCKNFKKISFLERIIHFYQALLSVFQQFAVCLQILVWRSKD